jgi:phage-related protein
VKKDLAGRISCNASVDDATPFFSTMDEMSQIWDIKQVKAARFHVKARDVIQEFSVEIRRELGKAIFDLQKGMKLGMPLSRTMASVGAGVEELRIKDRDGAYRIFYLARFTTEILIIHAFTKKTKKTPISEIAIGKKRLKELLDEKN